MKRTALILTMLLPLFFCDKANAQLNVTAAVKDKPERLMVGQVSYSYLYKTGLGRYEYWARTDNRFDQNYTTLFLGDTPKSAVQTLNDLKSLMENEVAGVSVQQEDGDVILTYAKQFGVKMLWIKQSGQGGRSWISLPLVEKFIAYFVREFGDEVEGSKEDQEPQNQ